MVKADAVDLIDTLLALSNSMGPEYTNFILLDTNDSDSIISDVIDGIIESIPEDIADIIPLKLLVIVLSNSSSSG